MKKKILNDIKQNKIIYLLVLFFFCLFTYKIFTSLDNDFFHIAVSGRWMVQNKSIMYDNVQFVKDGYQTVIQQWLYSILLYEASRFGTLGVSLFTYIQFIVLILVSYKLLKIYGFDMKISLCIIMIALYPMNDYISCRPQMISIILLLWQIIATEKYKRTLQKKWLYILPICTLLEINLHGTFWIFHFIFLLPYIMPFNLFVSHSKVQDDHINAKAFIVPILLMTGTLFINPYGYKMIACLFYSSVISNIGIIELETVSIVMKEFWFEIAALFIATYTYAKGRLTSTSFYFIMGLVVLELAVRRNVIFFVYTAFFLAKDFFDKENICKFEENARIITKSFGKVVILSTLLWILFYYHVIYKSTSINGVGEAFDYIECHEQNISDVKLYTEFNDGAGFLWEGIGKVYMQPKTEPYIEQLNGKKDIISEYCYITNYAGKEEIQSFLKDYDFDYLYLTESDQALRVYLETDDNYECVLSGEEEEVSNNYSVCKFYLYKQINR